MDFVRLSSNAAADGNSAVQGAGGHHRHMSMADRIDKMSSVIDDAVDNGKLTEDQATAMKEILEEIKAMLAEGGAGSGSMSGLSSDDRHMVRDKMRDVGKQLFAALNSQAAGNAGPTSSDPINQLFSRIDANGNGSVNKSEFSSFLSAYAGSGGQYSARGSISISQTTVQMFSQTQINILA